MGLLVLALLVMICCCRCANQRRRKRHLEKRIEEEQNKEQTHDLIIKPNSSLYQRQSVKQNNIFRLDSHHGPDPQVMLDYTNEETLLKNGLIFEDILPAKPEADKNTTINETTINDTTVNESDAVDESSKNTSFNVHEPTPSTTESPRAKAASNSPQQFRLPPINMANTPFKCTCRRRQRRQCRPIRPRLARPRRPSHCSIILRRKRTQRRQRPKFQSHWSTVWHTRHWRENFFH